MVSATERELLRFQLNMWRGFQPALRELKSALRELKSALRGLKPAPHVQLDPTVVAVIFKLFDINYRRQSRMIGASI